MENLDEYSDAYRDVVQRSIAFSGQELEYFTRRKVEHLLDVTTRRLGDPGRCSFLDVGCGVGVTDDMLAGRVGALHGVDVASEAVVRAAERNPTVSYCAYDGSALPYDEGFFDVVFAICVAHHVDVADRSRFFGEMRRVVRPGGLVAVFEHNPFNPLTRVAVSRCEFDEDVILLRRRSAAGSLRSAGLTPVEARYIIFSTSERARIIAFERVLRGVPLGAQHYVVARRDA